MIRFCLGQPCKLFVLCEVLAMGSPLYEKLNGLNDAEISSAPTPAQILRQLASDTCTDKYSCFKDFDIKCTLYRSDNDRLFLTWDLLRYVNDTECHPQLFDRWLSKQLYPQPFMRIIKSILRL